MAVGATMTYGLGLNLAMGAMSNLIVQEAPADRTGEAAGVNATVRTVGGAIGTQVVASVLAVSATGSRAPTGAGFVLAFGLCSVLLVAGLLLYAVMRNTRRTGSAPLG